MIRPGIKSFLVTVIVFTALTCIDPYVPKFSSSKPVLVVEGIITNENIGYTIKLSQSVRDRDSSSVKISDATVWITDDEGVVTNLNPAGSGLYRTDSLTFRGETGKSYQLHIKTSNGSVYASDTCRMLPVPDIDTLYYQKETRLSDDQTVSRKGLAIYLNSKKGTGDKYFLRWEYDEDWKFRVPDPTTYVYQNDSTIYPIPPAQVKEFCWKSSKSGEIMTGGVLPGSEGQIENQSIKFIAPEESDRLTVRYSILVKQYSISQKEYDFWNNLSQVSETDGNIFGPQPFSVLSNVKNTEDPSEAVLGYFEVSAVSQKRLYINFEETLSMNLPFYSYNCQRIVVSPSDYDVNPWAQPMTFDDLYYMYIGTKGYSFVEPIFDANGALTKMVFSTSVCSDCELTGSLTRPDFWTDK